MYTSIERNADILKIQYYPILFIIIITLFPIMTTYSIFDGNVVNAMHIGFYAIAIAFFAVVEHKTTIFDKRNSTVTVQSKTPFRHKKEYFNIDDIKKIKIGDYYENLEGYKCCISIETKDKIHRVTSGETKKNPPTLHKNQRFPR